MLLHGIFPVNKVWTETEEGDEASEKITVFDGRGSVHAQGPEKARIHRTENCAYGPFSKLREIRNFDSIPNFDRRGICSRFIT